MKRDPFHQLRTLRAKRTEIAMERVRLCQSTLTQAETALAEAGEAIESHNATTREHETTGLSQMLGKIVTSADLMNFHSELEHLVHRLEDLRSAEKSAQQEHENALSKLKSATNLFRKRHRSVEKLDYLLSDIQRSAQKKNLAKSEADDDEFHNRNQAFIPAKQSRS